MTLGFAEDSECNILHIDMDCFFASCEEKLNPQIKGRPVIVGGLSERGVVSAANYEARKYGVHSAMSMKKALSICPKGVFLSARIGVYKEISQQVFAIFSRYTDVIEPLSIDEAFLDVSAQRNVFGSSYEIAQKIRAEIKTELDLVASVGIAENMFLAKIASGRAKPDGVFLIPKNTSIDFLHELPISVIWGLGGKNQAVLKAKGYDKVGDLANVSLEQMRYFLGDALGRKVFDLVRGVDRRKVAESSHDKSFSNERTFRKDIYDYLSLRNEILFLSKKCGFSLRNNGYLAKTVSLKIKFSDFSTVTRDMTISVPTIDDNVIFDTVMFLLDKIDYRKGVRLVGVKVCNLVDEKGGVIQTLFDDFENVSSDLLGRKENLLKVSDKLKVLYGEDIILPASLLNRNEK